MGQMVKGIGKQRWGERNFWRALVVGMRNPSERQWWWDTLGMGVLATSMFCSVGLVRKSCREKVINHPVHQAVCFYPLLPSPRAVMCPAAGRLLRDGCCGVAAFICPQLTGSAGSASAVHLGEGT